MPRARRDGNGALVGAFCVLLFVCHPPDVGAAGGLDEALVFGIEDNPIEANMSSLLSLLGVGFGFDIVLGFWPKLVILDTPFPPI